MEVVSGADNAGFCLSQQDTARFIALLDAISAGRYDDKMHQEHYDECEELMLVSMLFRRECPITIARAPGRMDVMGGIADYSGSVVCEMTTKEAVHVAVQLQTDAASSALKYPTKSPEQQQMDETVNTNGAENEDPEERDGIDAEEDVMLRIVSMPVGQGDGRTTACTLSLTRLASVTSYAEADAFFKEVSDSGEGNRGRWVRYIAGCLVVLVLEKKLDLRRLVSGDDVYIVMKNRSGTNSGNGEYDERKTQQRKRTTSSSDATTSSAPLGGGGGGGGGLMATAKKTLRKLKRKDTSSSQKPKMLRRRLKQVAILVKSDVPEGKGVASSAAVEVAAMQALAAAFDDVRPLHADASTDAADTTHTADAVPPILETPEELAMLAQKVETLVVGAPCGIMDQMTVVCGRENHLLVLECQSPLVTSSFSSSRDHVDDGTMDRNPARRKARVLGHIPIPRGVHFIGIDSGVRHDNSSSSSSSNDTNDVDDDAMVVDDYVGVRTAAFMGRKIIMRTGFVPKVSTQDPRRQFYLCELDPYIFESKLAKLLPERMLGATFLESYGTHNDDDAYEYIGPTASSSDVLSTPSVSSSTSAVASLTITTVDPKRLYRVRRACRHPISESMRTRQFIQLLEMSAALQAPASASASLVASLGACMKQSHLSYSSVGLGSSATDAIVDLAVQYGFGGAKISGGGSGGTCVVVGDDVAAKDETVAMLVQAYAEKRRCASGGEKTTETEKTDTSDAWSSIFAHLSPSMLLPTSIVGGPTNSGHPPRPPPQLLPYHVFRGSSAGAAQFDTLQVKFSSFLLGSSTPAKHHDAAVISSPSMKAADSSIFASCW